MRRLVPNNRIHPHCVAQHSMSNTEPSKKVKELIDANLRRVFSEAESEELPDRFRVLLDQLKETPPPQDDGSEQ